MKKQLDIVQTRGAQLRTDSVHVENRTAQFVISTEAVDSYGTVFKADGWDLTRYNLNPVVFFNHNSHGPDPDSAIGTSRVFLENGQLIGEVTFEDDENEIAKKVFRKIVKGTLRGASIHAQPSEARWGLKDKGEDPDILYFTRQDLMEWSIVNIPSNPQALKRNVEAIDAFKEELKPEPRKVKSANSMSSFDAQLLINQNL